MMDADDFDIEMERRIDGFVSEYPDAEFGPAHIVLADGNVFPGHISWCLNLAIATIATRMLQALNCADANLAYDLNCVDADDIELIEGLDYYRPDHTLTELAATVEFLEQLLGWVKEQEADVV